MDVSIKEKGLIYTTPAIKMFFSTSGIHDFIKDALVIIISDSDSSFWGDNRDKDHFFQKMLSNNNAVLEPVKLNYHHASGVIDIFAKSFNRVLSKELF